MKYASTFPDLLSNYIFRVEKGWKDGRKEVGKGWRRPGRMLVKTNFVVGLIGVFASLRLSPTLHCCMFFEAPHYGNLALNVVQSLTFETRAHRRI